MKNDEYKRMLLVRRMNQHTRLLKELHDALTHRCLERSALHEKLSRLDADLKGLFHLLRD